MAVNDQGGVFETILRMRDEASASVKGFAEKVKSTLSETQKQADEAAKKTDESNKKVESSSSVHVASYGKIAVAAGAATAAVAAFAVKTLRGGLDAAEQAGDTAKRIGITVEAYTQLQHVATVANVSQETLNTALTTFAKNASKAVEGGGPLAKAFEQLGIDAQTFTDLSPEEKLFAVAEGLQKLPEGFDRARFAQEIFGKAGAAMINVLEGGSKGLQANMQHAHELGVTITGETAEAASKFNKHMDDLVANLGSIQTKTTENVAPAFALLAGMFQKFVEDSGVVEAATLGLTLMLKGLAFTANLIGDIFSFTGKIIAGAAASIVLLLKGEFKESANVARELSKDLQETAKRSAEVYDKLLRNEDKRQKPSKPGAKKTAFGFEEEGYGFRKTNSLEGESAFGLFTYSDVMPGAELITRSREEGFQEEIAALDEHHEEVEEKTRAHTIRLTDYDRSARAVRFQMGQQYDKLSLESSAFFFSQMGALMQTKSRAMFEIGKAGAIGETIIQTYRAAQGAYASLASIPFVGPALGAAAAAAAIAVGFARVQAIRSTSFGGASGSPVLTSGGYSGPVVAGGAGVALPPPDSLQGVAAPRQREVNIYLEGEGSPTQNYIRDVFVPALNDALGGGVRLNIRPV